LLSIVALTVLYRFAGFSRLLFVVYGLVLFLGVAGSRLSFRLFGMLFGATRKEKVPVLIYGAGDGGEAVVRECRKNSGLAYRPIGFLDDDPQKEGRTVLGLRIFGPVGRLPEILKQEKVDGCIISSPSILANGQADQIRSICQEQGLWMKRLRLDFVEENTRDS
jgi:UDP-GlcNAc:undecaprenyl-phosphate GlcNAc-1-phosphate transferase